MIRGNRAWLIIVLVLLLDVVTIVFPLFSPPLRWLTAVVLTAIALFFAWLRWIDRRAQREQERAAYAALERSRRTA